MNSYRICGLSVASDIVLPGLIAGEPYSAPQVTIRRGAVPEALHEPSKVGPTWQIAGKQFLLHVPNVARFLLEAGEQIVFAPESEASAEDIPIFILGTVFGILLHQREQIVLHASAVEVNGRAIVFCGPSGAGKSTLAAALAQRGYRLLTDDVCAITLSANTAPIVHPDGRQLKLWAQAIEQLELESVRRERVRGCLEKFYVEPRDATNAALPLTAIYELRGALHTDCLTIERPSVVDAAMLLRSNAYRPLLVFRLDQKAHYFRAAAQIIDQTGIFVLTRPFEFGAMSGVVSRLERHWRDTGVLEQAA
ncbi:MAG: HPr kinase/phosphorylase [Candidatus Binatia bacterium]